MTCDDVSYKSIISYLIYHIPYVLDMFQKTFGNQTIFQNYSEIFVKIENIFAPPTALAQVTLKLCL